MLAVIPPFLAGTQLYDCPGAEEKKNIAIFTYNFWA